MREFEFLKKVDSKDIDYVKGLMDSIDFQAHIQLGDYIVEKFDEYIDEAIYFYKLGVKKKDIEAMHRLGAIYVTPKFNNYDVKKGLKLLDKSAKGGCSYSQILLGAFYYNSNILAPSLEKSIYWYTRAANLDEEDALLRLARVYQYDYFSDDSKRKAFSLYERAIAKGNDEATKELFNLVMSRPDLFVNE